MTLANMSQRKKILISGFIAWVISLVSSLNIYLLSMDGDWSRFELGIVITALLTSIISGLKDLLAFLAESPKKPIVTLDPVIDNEPLDTFVEPVRPQIDIQALRTRLKADEGYRERVYLDSTGHKTVGYGHLLKQGEPEYMLEVGDQVSEARIDDWFDTDIKQAIADARSVVQDFDSHPQSVKQALINMAFNLGRSRLAGFKNTLALINARSYADAATEALNSKWADQVGNRAKRVAAMMANGKPDMVLA